MGNDRPLWLDILLVTILGFATIWWLFEGAPVPRLAVKPITSNEDLKTFDEAQEEIRQTGEYVPAIKTTRPDTNARRNELRHRLKVALDDLEAAPCSEHRARLLAKEVTAYTQAIAKAWDRKVWRTAADLALNERIQSLIRSGLLATEDFDKVPPIAGLHSRDGRGRCY